MRAWNWILTSLVVAGCLSGCDTFATSTGEYNQPCFGDGTCLEGLICYSASDTCILPEEDCGDRECGPSPNLGNDCGTCSGATEVCLSGQCVVFEWQDPPAANTMTWENAVDYCDTLSFNGHSDWHLPTISDLRSLVRGCPATEFGGSCGVTDDCLSDGSCWDGVSCAGCSSGQGPAEGCYWPSGMVGSCSVYWSSSLREDLADIAWDVDFDFGSVHHYDFGGINLDVRCVRHGD